MKFKFSYINEHFLFYPPEFAGIRKLLCNSEKLQTLNLYSYGLKFIMFMVTKDGFMDSFHLWFSQVYLIINNWFLIPIA